MKEIAKERFLQDFFAIKGNHEAYKINDLKDQYIQNPNLEIWSNPKVAAALKILDIWLIEAEKSDFEKSRNIANSAIEGLYNASWDLDCIDLFSHVVHYADDYPAMFVKAIDALVEYKDDKRCVNIEVNLHTVMTVRIQRDLFYNSIKSPPCIENKKQLEGLFTVSYGRILAMSQGGVKHPLHVAAGAIRYGNIMRDITRVNKGFEILKKAKEKEIIRLLLKEIQDYAQDPTWRSLEPFMKWVRYSQYKIS